MTENTMTPKELNEIKARAEVLTRAIEHDWREKETSAHSTDYWMRCAIDMSRAIPKLTVEVERLRGEVVEADDDVDEEIKERDTYSDLLDKFAYSVASIEVIGEHSSGNDPWQNALDILTSADEADRLRADIAHLRKSWAAVTRCLLKQGRHEELTSDDLRDVPASHSGLLQGHDAAHRTIRQQYARIQELEQELEDRAA